LLIATRRKRMEKDDATQALRRLFALPVIVQPSPTFSQLRDTLALAAAQALTVYDAAYLELARREALPLATDDAVMARAARAAGVALC
jgi:predicted nucleic acid-binding protein